MTWRAPEHWRRTLVAYLVAFSLCVPWYLAQRKEKVQPSVSGLVIEVVDGDTIEVSGLGTVRLVGINTPEKGQPGYQEALEFVRSNYLGKTVLVDVDDESPRDPYGRILGVVYFNGTNVNAQLLRCGLAKILYLPPSEFDPSSWQ